MPLSSRIRRRRITYGSGPVVVVPSGNVPGIPTSVVATTGGSSLLVSWTAPVSNGGSPITNYLVQYSSNNGLLWTDFPAGLYPTPTYLPVTGLTNGTAYVIKVYAVNAIGVSPSSHFSAPVTPVGSPVVVAPTVPGPPTGVSGLFGNTQVAVSWAAPASNGGSPITNYLVYYSSNNGSTWTNFAHAVSAATSITVTGLTNTVPYVFKAIAVNSVGNSASSANSASLMRKVGTP